MIFRKLKALFEEQFHIPVENLVEDALLFEDLGLDKVELALALEGTFDLEPVEDLSNLETLEDLMDFLQGLLDM